MLITGQTLFAFVDPNDQNLIRLSVGLEDISDLVADLKAALAG